MRVTVVILTCNRLNYLLQALQSVLKQKLNDPYSLKIVVSDNSTNSDTENHFLSHVYDQVSYIRRIPNVSGIEHYNLVLNEIDSDFFMIFHDDDIMGDHMIEKLLTGFSPTVVAVACNTYIIEGNTITKKKLVKDAYTPIPIHTQKELINCFMLRRGGPPFPSYLYRNVVSQLRLDPWYKKHGDVHFVSQVLTLGDIYFIKEPLFYYRLHSGQDSFYSDFIGISRLVNYGIKVCGYSRKDKPVIDWRLSNIYGEYRVQLLSNSMPSWRRMAHFITFCIVTGNVVLIAILLVRYIQYKLD